jgi:hypothetical protein
MIPAVRLASHEIEDLMKARSREARLKRLHQVRFRLVRLLSIHCQ